MEGQRCKGLVNLHQSPEERRAKYALCISLGRNRSWSAAMRDWRWNKIARFFGYYDMKHMSAILLEGEPSHDTLS